MESDPILTYAPRRHDGRLGLHQWPPGYPVARLRRPEILDPRK